MSIDPILDGTEYDLTEYVYEVVNFTAYLYVRDNPLRWVDPLGLKIADSASYIYLDGNGGGSKNEIVDPKPSMSEADKFNIPTNITPDIKSATANEQDKVRATAISARFDYAMDKGMDGGVSTAGTEGGFGGLLYELGILTYDALTAIGDIWDNIASENGGIVSSSISGYMRKFACEDETARAKWEQIKVIARVQRARENYACYFEIRFENVIVPILGRPLTWAEAVAHLRRGQNVITYFRSRAASAANAAGNARAMHHQKHGGIGYFNHYHINQHTNSSHCFYIVGG